MSARNAPVIDCPECGGLTFTVHPCVCASGGDSLLVEWDAVAGEPYRDCQLCHGAGGVAEGCQRCRQRGLRRAQLVLTVANVDTGAVASRNVVPGSLEPAPAPCGGWHLPLAPVVAELAGVVGAGSVTDVGTSRPPSDEAGVWLPAAWRPDLPAEQRCALEAEGIAGQDHNPWRLYLGRTAPAPTPDLDDALSRLCVAADLLCLDLVVEARCQRWGDAGWDIRYDLPDADVPATPRRSHPDLPEAVAGTAVVDALDGLAERGLTAGAYAIRSATGDRPPPPKMDLDQLERRMSADLAGGAPGAQAIWRDGRWWHTRLRPGGTTEALHERVTGQIVRRRVTALHRVCEPPAPSWQGEAIAWRPCGDCDPGSRLRRCDCTPADRPADPACPACCGAGYAPSVFACHTCRDSHRVHHATMVTVTDLCTRAEHQLWQPKAGEPATPAGSQPGGKPVYAVPDRYRLASWAATFGVRPEDLTDLDGGHPISQDLRDGIVTPQRPGTDPVIEYVTTAGTGRPGARLLVLAAVPDVPPLVDVIRLAHGLHLAAAVTVADHRLNTGDPTLTHGRRWHVEIVPPDWPADRFGPPYQPTIEAAVAHCLEYLDNAVCAAVPDDLDQPIRVPQSVVPAEVADPTALVTRVGGHYAGQPVTVHFERAGCRVLLRERDGVRLLARAATLADALAALRLHPA